MTSEAALSGNQGVSSSGSDVGAGSSVGASPAPSQSGVPNSSANVQTATVQSSATQQPPSETDPLANVPTAEAAQAMETVSKEAFLNLRGAYDEVAPKFKELNAKWEGYQPHLERFEQPEQLEAAIRLNDSLFGYVRDDHNQLVPATDQFAQDLATRDPLVADYLAADLMNGTTRDPETGQEIPRIDLALQEMSRDPARRATALKILGGVEPSSIAPTWQPSDAELTAILRDPDNPTQQERELQDIYRKLPYDKREALKLNDPDFIRDYLTEKQDSQRIADLNRQSLEREQRETQRREAYMAQRAQEAGNTYVEQGFRTGMTEFAQSIVEKSQFIQPLDPQSEAAKAMDPAQVTAFNQSAQRINTGVGKIVATVTGALAHPDTSWMMQDILKDLGVDPVTLTKFDEARRAYADNARNYGELNFQLTGGQPRNGGSVPEGLTAAQYQASQAMKSMKGYGNLVSQSLMKLFSEFFEMKAGSYNTQLNGSGTVRPQVNGSHFDPTTAPAQVRSPNGQIWPTKAELERQYS